MEAFKKEIIDHFNINAINGKGKLQSIVIFIIEKDGSIITAKGFGENQNFNKQAELAVLLIQKKWEPAIRNGQPERAYMSVPLTLNFD
ncbi:energy transducer TonB [Chryseobacterium sp. MEBOG07]|nr:energy transducer TonB [Chryseobacterium sp. MEBOG07]UKB79463.1 energy transducer TonB [Chryseobacterium sp. MEBOG07]